MSDKENLKRFLIRCCYWYYVKCEPLISDYDYDVYYKRLQEMESKDELANIDSPTQKIWGDSEDQYTKDWMKTKELLE